MISGEGERHLVIRNVTLNDAGVYTARDEINQLEASANFTVIGQFLCILLFNYSTPGPVTTWMGDRVNSDW